MRSKPFSLADLATAFPDLSDFKYLDSGSFKAVYRVESGSKTTEVLKLVREELDAFEELAEL